MSQVVLFILFAMTLLAASGMLPLVRFPKEDICIHVYANSVEVEGNYVYRNPHAVPVRQGFVIPFPQGSDLSSAYDISLEEVQPASGPIQFYRSFGQYRFELGFAPGQEITVRLHYRQFAASRQGCYILTTTNAWGRTLEWGRYQLLPQGVALVKTNYGSIPPNEGAVEFVKTNFFPQKDWHFSWEPL